MRGRGADAGGPALPESASECSDCLLALRLTACCGQASVLESAEQACKAVMTALAPQFEKDVLALTHPEVSTAGLELPSCAMGAYLRAPGYRRRRAGA